MKRASRYLSAILFTGLSARAASKTVNIVTVSNPDMIVLKKLSAKFEAAKVSDPSHVPVTATIELSEPMGSESIVYFKAATGNLIARVPGEHVYHPARN